MAVFTVTSALDGSSGGTLRQAIEAANNTAGADTIVFSASLSDDLDLRGDALEITDDLTIDFNDLTLDCLLYTSPSPRDQRGTRMPSSA